MPICEVDGLAVEGGLWLDAPCNDPATHQYRPADKPDAKPRYRCAAHAKFSLFAAPVVVEEIGGGS